MSAPSASYQITLHPAEHELEARLTLHGLGPGPLRVETPTWVPGAYGFMKYGRDLFEVAATDGATGRALPVRRDGWAGYQIEGAGESVEIRWRAYGWDPAWGEFAGLVGHDQAVLLATRYLYAPSHAGPCRVRYELPPGWDLHHPAGATAVDAQTFEYPSFLALLDTPVVCGSFERRTRRAHGTDFHFVFLDRAVGYDQRVEEFLDALMRVAEECRLVFGSFPFDAYTFVFSFNPTAKWGLEHAHATMVGLGDELFVDEAAWLRGLRVSAHELFHAWNGCRLKSAPLGRPDLARGSFPEALWIGEGATRYYEFLLLVRAGLVGPEVLFSNVVNYYRQLVAHPAYERVSVFDSSLTTFLNHNRYPGSVNATIDYYDKGMLVCFDLDAALRTGKAEEGLDHALRELYRSFAGKGEGMGHASARRLLAGLDPSVDALIAREVEGPAGLQTVELLRAVGFEVQLEQVPFLGLVLAGEGSGPEVANVVDTSPAGGSGLAPGDRLVRVEGFPFALKALRWLVERDLPVRLEVDRGNRRLEFAVRPARRERVARLLWKGSRAQAERLERWLKVKLPWSEGQAVSLQSYENFHGNQMVL